MTNDNDAVLEKIRKLILHAEGTKNEGEAANYWGKAQELMHKYAIDEATARASGKPVGRPVMRRIDEVGIKDFRKAKVMLLNTVARHNGCKLVDCHTHCVVVGMDTDTRFVEMLYVSLLLEGWQWLLKDRREDPEGRRRPNVYTGNWLEAYTYRISTRLAEANKKAESEYKTVAGDPNGVAIVLAGRDLQVKTALEEFFPHLSRGRAGGTRSYIGSAREAGSRAGDRADLSGGANRIGGGSSKRLT